MRISSAIPERLARVLTGVLLLPLAAMAGTTGKIAGQVTDARTGEPLPGATVIIRAQIVDGRETALQPVQGTGADDKGRYFLINVRPGQYVLEASVIGYQRVVKRPIRVEVDRTSTIDFALSEEALAGEEVVVTAERPLVVKDLTSSSAKVSGEDLKALPVEGFQEVLTLQAGVTRGLGGDLHIRGGRSSEIQFYVDGIAIANPFSNSLAVPVENNAIQELEVISGTFNAEYGQAMSGIVNIVTREGSESYRGSFSVYAGDFLSRRDEVFYNIDKIDPLAQRYAEADFSGPLFTPKLKFFASGRFTDQENWLYGRRVFLPGDSSSFRATDPSQYYLERRGDSAAVAMNPYQSLSGQVKLTYNLTPKIKLSYNLLASASEGQSFSNFYRFNPDYRPTSYTRAHNHMFRVDHVLGRRAFYTLNLASYENDVKSYVYKDPFDPRYRATFERGIQPQFVFSTGGVSPAHFYRNGKTYALRGDLTMQVNNAHLVKAGAEVRYHKLKNEFFNVEVNPRKYGDYAVRIPPLSSFDHDAYDRDPLEFAAYVQDKIEIKDLIVNAGLRFDYFDARATVPVDLRDPGNKIFIQEEALAYRSVKAKTQVSPRLGLAFPITAQGVIHASYGQFFQIPEFSRLYDNPEFEVVGAFNSIIGNADLEPQRTDMYEVGLQQQLTSFLAVDLTGFYRDVRNLLGTDLHETYAADLYGRYTNSDYGSVRGVTLSAEIRLPSHHLTGGFDYTYQVAKGIASDPRQKFFDAQGRNESAIVLADLDWDLRHNGNAYLNWAHASWGGSLIARLNSGYPFTPARFIELRNEGRYKGDLFLDLRAYKRFNLGTVRPEFFVKVDNLLDSFRRDLLPQVDPRDEAAHRANGLDLINTRYQFALNPASQPVPREVKFGVKVDF